MILVCDTTVSDRAISLRNELLDRGYPASVSSVDEIRNHKPFCLILTFTDVFNEVRRTPYDEVFVVAVGDDFINTALNATQAKDVTDAVSVAQNYLRESCVRDGGELFGNGVFVQPFFLAEGFFEVYSSLVIPTESEFLIFKFLLFCTQRSVYASADVIRDFCFPRKSFESNVIAAHISSLNKKISEAYGKKIIKSKRFMGYYLDKT